MITLYKKIRINHEIQFLTNKILNDKIKKKLNLKKNDQNIITISLG